MHPGMILLLGAWLGVADVREYHRDLGARALDQAAFDAETYGDKKALERKPEGLRVSVAPGSPETGWKLPQNLRIGGNFTLTARFTVRKLPKPAQDDGVAVGVAVASQNTDQPDAVLVRVIEPTGPDVYRTVDKGGNNPNGMMMGGMPMMMMEMQPRGPGAKPIKPPRKTFPARGESVVMELRREGPVLRYAVLDAESNAPRYLGQTQLGPGDIAGIKLFATNRNGAEALDIVLHEMTVRAERFNGLGTEVRTVFGTVVHGDPMGLEGGKLLVGAPSRPANAGSAEATASPTPAGTAATMSPGAPGVGAVMIAQGGAVVARVVVAAPAVAVAAAAAPAAPAEPPKPADKPATPADAAKKATAAPKAAAKPEPKARIPLDEVESIAFERAVTVSGRVVGQPNLDFTMGRDPNEKADAAPPADVLDVPPGTITPAKVPKLEPKPNGIRDVHLSIANLRPAPIRQVTVNAQTDKGATAYRLDTSDSRDWPLVLRRAGTEGWADLFLEPPPGDIKGKSLTVNISYQDGQSANASITSEVSTDPKLAYDPKAPAPSFDARVYLAGGEQLFGRFEGLDGDNLRLRTPWGDRLTVPLVHVGGIYMGLPDHKESSESFERRLRARGTDDLLLARSKEGDVVAITGVAEKTEGDRLQFLFQGKARGLSLRQVEGLVLAARPEPTPPDAPRARFTMAGGLVVSGRWLALDDKTWKVETVWGQPLNLPAAEVQSVRFRGGQMTYLSDLEPSRVEETPYFGRRAPWRKDVSLAGGPLEIGDQTFARGLAVHARTVLTYDLNGHYARFRTVVGFDKSAGKAGRVDCRVVADGKVLHANPDLRADGPAVPLDLAVAGVKQLQLVVDFGNDQDTGDRVIWANARLFRQPPPTTTATTAAPPPTTTDRDRKTERKP